MTDTTLHIPPQNMQPGYVQPVADEPAKAEDDAAKAASVQADLATAVAALTATLNKPADKAAEAEVAVEAPASLNALSLDSIQDPVLRSMATVMRSVAKDVDMDRVFAKALESGDPDMLDIAYLKEKAGASAPELITIATGIVQAIQAKAVAAQEAVHALAGGADAWNACTAAFNKAAPNELRVTVVQMMNSGNEAHVKAASKLVVEFAKGQGLVSTPAGLVKENGAAATTGSGLSKAEFQTALQGLNPNSKTYTAERETLYARRQLGKNLGN